MAIRYSRRRLASFLAENVGGPNEKKALKQVAAYLVEFRRTKEADLIVRDVLSLMKDMGIVTAHITSARPLSDAVERQLTAFIKQKTAATSVSVESSVDPTVIGGVKISLPGAELDQTIAHQLKRLRTEYKKA
jgi:F-type H+-transporting ATPase subunit delta